MVVFMEKGLSSGKVDALEQRFGQKVLYSSKVFGFGQKWLYLGKVLVFG